MKAFFTGDHRTPDQKAKDIAREGKSQIRGETRQLDKDLRKLHQEEEKIKKQIDAEAKKGNAAGVQSLAKQLVQARKACERLEKVKGSMGNVNSQLTCAAATMSVASSMATSAKVMKDIGGLVDVAEIQGTMDSMKREMARAEMADEMIEEGFADLDDEDEIDAEMAKVLEDLEIDTQMMMSEGSRPTYLAGYAAPVAAPVAAPAAPAAPDPLAARLAALQAA